MSLASSKLRLEFGTQDAIRDAGLKTPEGIRRWDDIAYGAHPQQVLDVYRPKDASGKLPVIVNVHGGGWVYGDKDLYQYYTMSLALRGFAVVNFSYRLAPETKHPAQIEDVNSVFLWTQAHAEEYGFDMENLFAVGDSAGGHLLGLYSCLCTNPAFAATYAFAKLGPTPKAVSLACGAYAMATKGPNFRAQDMALMADLLPGAVTEEALEAINVLSHITPDFPEAFFFTCTGDFLQEQADALQLVLRKNCVPHIMRFYCDKKHELGHVFHCNMKSEAARRCNDEQCEFFKTVMNR